MNTYHKKLFDKTAILHHRKWMIFILISVLIVFAIVSYIHHMNKPNQRINSIIEIGDEVYILKADGSLYLLNNEDKLHLVDHLPSNKVYSDGDRIYMVENNHVYQYDPNNKKSTSVWNDSEIEGISLDYINDDIIVIHSGNHEAYKAINRQTGQINDLFQQEDSKYFTLLDMNDEFALFSYNYHNYSEKPYDRRDSLYVLNISRFQLLEILDGLVIDACISKNNIVYAMPADKTNQIIETYSSSLVSIDLNNNQQKIIDLSEIEYRRIQEIASCGDDLIFATDMIDNQNPMLSDSESTYHYGSMYRYDPMRKKVMIVNSSIGMVNNLITSDHYCSYYDRYDHNQSPNQDVIIRID